MHILYHRHVAALKHHYPSRTTSSVTVTRGWMRGGMPRMSEEELLALIQGMPATVRDAMVSSNAVETPICSGCPRPVINCDCPRPKPPAAMVVVNTRAWFRTCA